MRNRTGGEILDRRRNKIKGKIIGWVEKWTRGETRRNWIRGEIEEKKQGNRRNTTRGGMA